MAILVETATLLPLAVICPRPRQVGANRAAGHVGRTAGDAFPPTETAASKPMARTAMVVRAAAALRGARAIVAYIVASSQDRICACVAWQAFRKGRVRLAVAVLGASSGTRIPVVLVRDTQDVPVRTLFQLPEILLAYPAVRRLYAARQTSGLLPEQPLVRRTPSRAIAYLLRKQDEMRTPLAIIQAKLVLEDRVPTRLVREAPNYAK